MKPYTAAILGGSGSLGKCVLKSLLKDSNCQKVLLVSRRPLDDLVQDRVQVEVCHPLEDMANSSLPSRLKELSVNIGFNTMGAGAPSQVSKEELYHIDVTIPTLFAKQCKEAGTVSHFCVLSATGADSSAQWSNITRTGAGGGWSAHCKGKIEENTADLGFQYLFLAQPAALLGSPHTPAFLNYVPSFLLPDRFSSAHISDIAEGMVRSTINAYQNDKSGVVRVAGGVPLSKSE